MPYLLLQQALRQLVLLCPCDAQIRPSLQCGEPNIDADDQGEQRSHCDHESSNLQEDTIRGQNGSRQRDEEGDKGQYSCCHDS